LLAARQTPLLQASSAGAAQLRAAASNIGSAFPRTAIPSRSTESLRSARTVFIMSRSGFFNPSDLANELLKKSDFTQMGLTITKDRNAADLLIEVDRLIFTTHFPYVVVDPKNNTVVASGEVNSLFGTVPAKIAGAFTRQLKAARLATPDQ
jgi:hypothetical protein